MSSPMPKIPDMFTRALKRKSLQETAPNQMMEKEGAAKKARSVMKAEAPEVDKENAIEVKIQQQSSAITEVQDDIHLSDYIMCDAWKALIIPEFEKKYMRDVEQFLNKEYRKGAQIFPPRDEIFTAFNLTSISDVRVVIIGQDPYHNDGQAHGLSFSVKKGVKPPPSLKNVYKELSNDIDGFAAPDHGFLEGWAKQGVFMLNATLTVEAHKANSHEKIGWQKFTDEVIRMISKNTEYVVFVLWGGFAHKKEALIDSKKHGIIKTAHPSPLSARHWWGSRCFSKTNELLRNAGRREIDWKLL